MNSGTNASDRIATDIATIKMKNQRSFRRVRLSRRGPTSSSVVAMAMGYHIAWPIAAFHPLQTLTSLNRRLTRTSLLFRNGEVLGWQLSAEAYRHNPNGSVVPAARRH